MSNFTDLEVNDGGSQLKDFLSALTIGLQTNGTIMKAFETNQIKRATWNGRKMVLQAALNDIFGITTAPFIIVQNNASIGTNTFFYRASELSPVYFKRISENDPLYLFRSSEVPIVEYDFKILIPTGIYTTELNRRIKAQTEIYKLAGARFITETY